MIASRFNSWSRIALLLVGLVWLGGCRSSSSAAEPRSVSNPSSDMSDPLEPLAWERRPIVLFASEETEETYRDQIEVLQRHASGVDERHISIFRVVGVGSEAATLEGRGPDGELNESEARALVERFEPSSPFTFVLVGKDTTEKLRSGDVVSAERLFETIDAMPMRQREMQRQRDDDDDTGE